MRLEEDPDGALPDVKDELIKRNLRLVLKIAKRYGGNGRLDIEDLFQCGVFGLMKAIEYFDVSSGNKLSTYASWWIRQAITRAITEKGYIVRLPVHLFEDIKTFNKLKNDLHNKLGREPLNEEIAEKMAFYYLLRELGREPSDEETAKKMAFYLNKVSQLRNVVISKETLSLDVPVDETNPESDNLADLIISPEKNPTEDTAFDNLRKEAVLTVVNNILEPRKRKIIILRFGLEGNGSRTLDEVGKEIGLTKERIRQLEGEAINELRKFPDIIKLRDFID